MHRECILVYHMYHNLNVHSLFQQQLTRFNSSKASIPFLLTFLFTSALSSFLFSFSLSIKVHRGFPALDKAAIIFLFLFLFTFLHKRSTDIDIFFASIFRSWHHHFFLSFMPTSIVQAPLPAPTAAIRESERDSIFLTCVLVISVSGDSLVSDPH